ncbi:PepSY domain-containing protein [Microbacterium alcoholitolerans]|uniref:PepSY domain-containing protein n=1 Tax=unclassified Microbacterium TaxID=2609290 RepID=UPI003D16825E
MNTDENTQPLPEDTAASAPIDAKSPRPRHRRNLLIGLGAAVALVAMGGGAYAIASAADDDDDRAASSAVSGAVAGSTDDDSTSDDDRPEDDDRRGDDDRAVATTGSAFAASDASAMRDAAEQAIAHVDGTGVTSIEVERGGYDIDVLLADGTEYDVFVGVDGTIREHRDDDDDSSDPALDLTKLGDIIAAAQSAATAEAGDAGVVDSVSTDDDSSKAYEVELRLNDRRDVEIELNADLTVVTIDIDD